VLRITPLGGIGEIGLNMMVLSSETDSILIDCGILFPSSSYFGTESIMLDYEQFFQYFPNVNNLFISHGHEDHIGAVPYLLKQGSVTVNASPFAAELIRNKCTKLWGKEFGANIVNAEYGEPIKCGSFTVEFIQVDHSIPDAAALFIRTQDCSILFATDFKLQGENKSGFLDRVRKIRKEFGNISILFSDSTNAPKEGACVPDKDVFDSLGDIFKKAKSKIIVTLFSSNIGRVNQIIALSKKFKKKLFIAGQNLKNNIEVARNLGYVEPDDSCIRHEDQFKLTPNEEIVLLCTGSQAEYNSSMFKLATGTHPFAAIEEDDTIIFSSSQIPGNERAIFDIINKLLEKGAKVVYSDEDNVHSSGHAHQDELRELLKVASPRIFIPIHGEYMHLKEHISLAVKEGVDPESCYIVKDGNELTYDGVNVNIIPGVVLNKLYLDSNSRDLIGEDVLKERYRAARNGILIINIIVNESGNIVKRPEAIAYGIPKNDRAKKIIESINWKVYDHCKSKPFTDYKENRINDIKSIAKKEFRKEFDGGKPEIIINLLHLENA
jgi:ribonuclease J